MLPEVPVQELKHGLLPTPPLPENLNPVELTKNARQVLLRRYVRRGEDGQPAESVEEMFWRVAYHVAAVEANWGGDPLARAAEFYELISSKSFFPNSPTFTGAGTPLGQLAACFVLPISDDMGRDPAGIFQTLRDAALIQQTGGGNGFSFSRLRPKNSLVNSSAGQATGPVGFLRVYDKAFGEIAQGGTRRGANMAVLRVDHPDIEEFIACKTSENAITNFNISVGVTDAFMQAVERDGEWELRFPDVTSPRYKGFQGTLEQAEAAGLPINVHKRLRARALFDQIVRQAHHNGEPGVLFLDASNRSNPVPHLYQLEATNPCVTGDTLIYTDQGLRRADQLAQEESAIRVVSDGRFGLETTLPASTVFATGVKPVYRLATREGYELRLTGDHCVMTPGGWAPAKDLRPGDRVHLLNRKGAFGSQGTLEEGRLLGWLVSEGARRAAQDALAFLGDDEWAPLLAEAFDGRAAPRGESAGRGDWRSDRLRAWAAAYGLAEDERSLPPAALAGSEPLQRGFLQALFTADGQVDDGAKKGGALRLNAAELPLLKDVQRLLLNFGILSRMDESRPAQPALLIRKASLARFADEIGFLSAAKQSRLADCLSRIERSPRSESFTARVASLRAEGEELVFDLHQPDTHAFIANGMVVHNCGEQWLGPYENCCLGSLNLAQHLGPQGTVNWDKLRRNVVLATYFLDDVVEANAYVPAVSQLKDAAHKARRIGLGIMGLGDLMYHAGIRYGSPEGQEFAAQVMEFVRYWSMHTSVELAKARGPFPAIAGSIYDPHNLQWQPPQSLVAYTQDWGRAALDWDAILQGIRRHGIRNAAQTTIAPTGTIATVAGCEGYGCEPVFALAYVRHVNDNGKDLQLTYTSPLFDAALQNAGLDEATRRQVVEQVMEHGTCQDIEVLPEAVRRVFVVSADITADEHVRTQAAMQAFVDNSLSKTVNFPAGATEEEVALAYQLAWKLDCKGITVYVTGSRQVVVLETKATARQKQADPAPLNHPDLKHSDLKHPELDPLKHTELDPLKHPELVEGPLSDSSQAQQLPIWHEDKKPRPRALHGYTYNVSTPLGKAFVTINENGGSQPFEVFLNTSKAGSDTAAVSEAIGRLISYILRLASPVAPHERLKEVWRQLVGIGGGRSLGFGASRVRSLPDGVAQVLSEYLEARQGHHEAIPALKSSGHDGNGHHLLTSAARPETHTDQHFLKIGDLCPECGEAAFVNEEGCRKCYACGHSEC